MANPPLEHASDLGDLIRTIETIRERLTVVQGDHRDRLPMWTIYGTGTSDYPGVYVMRLFLTLPTNMVTDLLVRGGSVQQLRDMVPSGLTRIPRMPGDDVNIIEVWV